MLKYGGGDKIMEKKRENIYLPYFLAEKVEKFADEMGIGKSAAYAVIVKQFFDYQEAISSMPVLMNALKGMNSLKGGNPLVFNLKKDQMVADEVLE